MHDHVLDAELLAQTVHHQVADAVGLVDAQVGRHLDVEIRLAVLRRTSQAVRASSAPMKSAERVSNLR